MTKLLIKHVTILLLALLVSLYLVQAGFDYFYYKNSTAVLLRVNDGVFREFQTKLDAVPVSKWQPLLNTLQADAQPPVTIVEGNLPETTINFGHLISFFNYKINSIYANISIPNSDHHVRIHLGLTLSRFLDDNFAWTISLINETLNTMPETQWPDYLKQLSQAENITFTLHHDAIGLPKTIQHQLQKQIIAYTINAANGYITNAYWQVKPHNAVIQLGPLNTNFFIMHYQNIKFYLLGLWILLTAILLTWFFNRNLNKIYEITKSYQEGNFNPPEKISRFSLLHDFYHNIKTMGQALQSLTLTRNRHIYDVSKHARHALVTINESMTKLQQYKNTNNQHHIDSLSEDARDLAHLVHNIEHYADTSEHRFNVKREPVCLSEWLKTVLQPYYASAATLTLTLPKSLQTRRIDLDPVLLKHVMNNLLTNAFKHCQDNVRVSASIKANTLIINVDDDGPGIAKENQGIIFEAFKTLTPNAQFGAHIGLGLSIAQAIAAQHEGYITATQSPTLSGARFTLKIANICHPRAGGEPSQI